MVHILPLFLFLIGLAMGSFVDALTWRLKTKRNFVTDRSECEHCHHKLGALDLIPVVSWLMLGGRCRYCRKPIGWQAPVLETVLGIVFVVSYFYWPLGFASWQAITLFGLWLMYMVALAALLVYDLKWMLLPDKLVFPLIGLAFFDAALRVSLMPGTNYFSYVTFGILILAGLYWLLYTVSKGRWVGYGDVKLSIFIGVALGWEKALLVLILANVIGFLVILPALATKALNRKSRVPFGPFLIVAFVIAGLFGDLIIQWYLYRFMAPGGL